MAKMDIVPIAICGFSGYAVLPFSKHLTLKIGKPISYELSEEEISNLSKTLAPVIAACDVSGKVYKSYKGSLRDEVKL